jgi:glycosyltransferase involved in cell wall biosynthesis
VTVTARSRHVAFVTTTLDVSGAERVIAHLADGMARTGARVSILALQGRSGALRKLVRESSVTVADVGMTGPLDLRAIGRLQRWLRTAHVDVVCTFLFHGHIVGRLAARWAGVPILISSQQVAQWGGPVRRLLERWTGRWCDAMIAVSQGVRDDLVTHYGVPSSRIHVIYNAIDVEAFRPSRAPFGTHGTVVFGSASRFAPEKDHASLIRGFAAARAARPELQLELRLAGSGPLESRLRRLATAFGPSSGISFVGQIRDVRRFYDALDVYVQSSWTEGLPCAVIEAMAMARPVIATDVPGNREAVEAGVTGRLIPPGSPDAWRDAILEAVDDPPRAKAFGRAGQVLAADRFDAARMVADTIRLVDELCARRSCSPHTVADRSA